MRLRASPCTPIGTRMVRDTAVRMGFSAPDAGRVRSGRRCGRIPPKRKSTDPTGSRRMSGRACSRAVALSSDRKQAPPHSGGRGCSGFGRARPVTGFDAIARAENAIGERGVRPDDGGDASDDRRVVMVVVDGRADDAVGDIGRDIARDNRRGYRFRLPRGCADARGSQIRDWRSIEKRQAGHESRKDRQERASDHRVGRQSCCGRPRCTATVGVAEQVTLPRSLYPWLNRPA
jgi:hypothetical protein